MQSTSAKESTAQRPYEGRTDVDSQSASAKSQHQRMRDVWKAARGKDLQPTSMITVSRLCKAGIPPESGICEKEVKTPWEIRYACPAGRKGADGREICTPDLF